ncbi:MAG: hypothetical protein ACREWG_07740 [Gammaproteobacteria bacterium]
MTICGRLGPAPRDAPPGSLPPEDLQAGSDPFELLILSAQYNGEHWSFTGEYALRHTEDQGFGPDFPDVAVTGESYYFQAMYRASPKWEALLRYDVFYADRDDRDGEEFEKITGLPGQNFFAKDWTIGARYYVTPAFMVAAEYYHVDGAGWLPRQDNPDLSALNFDRPPKTDLSHARSPIETDSLTCVLVGIMLRGRPL